MVFRSQEEANLVLWFEGLKVYKPAPPPALLLSVSKKHNVGTIATEVLVAHSRDTMSCRGALFI